MFLFGFLTLKKMTDTSGIFFNCKRQISVGECPGKKKQKQLKLEMFLFGFLTLKTKCKRQISLAFSEFLETSDISRKLQKTNCKKSRKTLYILKNLHIGNPDESFGYTVD